MMHTSWTQWKNRFTFEVFGQAGYLIVEGLGGSYGVEKLIIGSRPRNPDTSVGYSGNPEHKRNPGDFGLTPPSQPRPDKTLCDIVRIMTKHEAVSLLQEGVRKGMLSERFSNGFPQNIWAVTNEGYPVEAQLENEGLGTYHGYPMSEADPFHDEVLARWAKDKK